MRHPTLHFAPVLVLLAGCASSTPPPQQRASQVEVRPVPRSPGRELRPAQDLHAALLPHADAILACVEQALVGQPPHVLGSPRYVSMSATATRRESDDLEDLDDAPAFRRLLRTCLEVRAQDWTLPKRSVGVVDGGLEWVVGLHPATEKDPFPTWKACFESPEGAALRTELARSEDRGVVLWVAQTSQVVVLSKVAPQFTQRAAAERVAGEHVSRCRVTAGGFVTACKTLRSVRTMDEAAHRALHSWRLAPIRCNGRVGETLLQFRVLLNAR